MNPRTSLERTAGSKPAPAVAVALVLAACTLQADAKTAVVDAPSLTRTVDFSDLNLQRPRDVSLLYRRISNAAAVVCKPLAGRDMPRALHYRKCVNEAIEHAIADVHEPLLSEHYATLSGERILSPLLTPLNR